MTDQFVNIRTASIESPLAAWAGHRFTNNKRELRTAIKAFESRDKTAFNQLAEELLDEVRQFNCPLGHFPDEFRQMSRDDALAVFTDGLARVVAVLRAYPTMKLRDRLMLHYGYDLFARQESAPQSLHPELLMAEMEVATT